MALSTIRRLPLSSCFLVAVIFAAALALPPAKVQAEEPLRFAVTDIVGLEELQREFEKFQNLLSEKMGQPVKLYPVTNRTVVVESLKAQRVDLVLTGPAEYVVIAKKTNAVPLVGLSRPDYFSAIVVLSDSNVKSVEDLKGKKVAFGDIGSTSYHLAPMQVLSDSGLNPKDIVPVHINRHVGWEALKRNDVMAIGMNHDRYVQFRSHEKKLEPGAFRVIARGPDLPNDLLVAGAHVPAEIREKIRKVFSENSSELIKAILVGKRNQKYQGMKFITNIDDKDYDYVRAMYRTAGFPEYAEFIGQG